MARKALTDDDIRKRVLGEDWPLAETFKKQYNRDAVDGYRLYQNWKDPQLTASRLRRGRSNVHIAKFAEFTETKVPRYVESLFANAPEYVVMLPREPMDEALVKNATIGMNYYFEQADIVTKLVTGLKEVCYAGTHIIMPHWARTDTERQKWVGFDEYFATMQELPPEKYWTDELKEAMAAVGNNPMLLDPAILKSHKAPMMVVDTNEGPQAEQVPFIDFYPDPRAKDFKLTGAQWAMRRFRATKAELEQVNAGLKAKNLPARYMNLDELPKGGGGSGYTDGQREYYQALGHDAGTDWDQGTHDILEAWYKDGWVYSFANESILIRKERWPHWHGRLPFVLFVAIPDTYTPFGVPLWRWIRDELEDLSETARAARDLMNLNLAPPMAVQESAVVDPFDLQNIRPNKIIRLEHGSRVQDAIQWMPLPQTWPAAQQDIQAISQRLNDVTGLQAPIRGQPITRRTTVGEQQILVEEGNARLKMDIRVLNESLKMLANHFLWLAQQYAPDTLTARIEGERAEGDYSFVEIPRDNLDKNYDIYPASSSIEALANKGAQVQQLANFFNMTAQTPIVQMLDWAEVGKVSLQLMGIRHSGRMLPDQARKMAQAQQLLQDPQVGPMLAQMVQQMMQQQMAQQAPPVQGAQMNSGAATPEQQMGQDPVQQAMLENEQLLLGNPVPVDPAQDHATHLQMHEQAWVVGQEEGQDVTVLLEHAQQHQQMMGGMGGEQTAGGGIPAGLQASGAPAF